MVVESTGSNRPISPVTAANTCSGAVPRHQRRDPPQRGLLIGKLAQPRLIGWITAHPHVGGTGAVTYRLHKADGNPAPGRRQRLRRGPARLRSATHQHACSVALRGVSAPILGLA
jgi:hypothetical protein